MDRDAIEEVKMESDVFEYIAHHLVSDHESKLRESADVWYHYHSDVIERSKDDS